MLFQAVGIFLPILNFFKFHVKGERSIEIGLITLGKLVHISINTGRFRITVNILYRFLDKHVFSTEQYSIFPWHKILFIRIITAQISLITAEIGYHCIIE